MDFISQKYDDLYQELNQYCNDPLNLERLLACRWQLTTLFDGPFILKLISLTILSLKNILVKFRQILVIHQHSQNFL